MAYKDIVSQIKNPIDTLNKIYGYEFIWKETQKTSYGVIAQEIEKVLPSIVNDGEYKTVNYNAIIPFLIEAIKELNRKLNEK
jgi:hypothetical protein